MSEFSILYCKEGFTFAKNKKNNYVLTFQMENNYIILPKIIDFNLIKLIYDLNGDIYEKVHLQKIDDDQCKLVMVMKHLFEDIGLPQRYSHLHITKNTRQNNITFVSNSIYSERPEGIPEMAEQMSINHMICDCNVINNHKISFNCNILFEENVHIPPFAEKLVGLILFKIFNRVKQFVENVRI